jgi:hypothetical protein
MAYQEAIINFENKLNNLRKANGLPPIPKAPSSNLLPGQNPGAVTSGDVSDATQVYRDTVNSGKDVYGRILAKTGEPDPSAIKFYEQNKVAPGTIRAETITDPNRNLKGVQQGATTVEATNVSDLEATARGQGAGQQAAAARYNQLLQQQQGATNARVQAERGAERKGLRRAQLLAGGEQALQAGSKIAELDAQTSLTAQKDVATFDAERKQKQAELDAARLSGDADRIQKAQRDMVEFEQKAKEFNATQTQTANTTNVSNKLTADTTNLKAGTEAIKQDFETWKQTNQLALDAQKALEQSAQGLLNEDQRQQTLAMARAQLAKAQEEFEYLKSRNAKQDEINAANQRMAFWGTMITSLVAAGTTIATSNPAVGAAAGQAAGAGVKAAAAEHGGAVDRTTMALIGEAGDHELVIPIKGKLSDRMMALLNIDSKPFQASGPSGQIDNMSDLTKAIRATLKTAPAADDDMTSMLAAANIRAKRGR